VPETVFVVPSLPEDEVKERLDQLLAELRGILGEERWPLVQATLAQATLVKPGYTGYVASESILSQLKQELSISVAADD
jgi:hypothetical protein